MVAHRAIPLPISMWGDKLGLVDRPGPNLLAGFTNSRVACPVRMVQTWPFFPFHLCRFILIGFCVHFCLGCIMATLVFFLYFVADFAGCVNVALEYGDSQEHSAQLKLLRRNPSSSPLAGAPLLPPSFSIPRESLHVFFTASSAILLWRSSRLPFVFAFRSWVSFFSTPAVPVVRYCPFQETAPNCGSSPYRRKRLLG